MSPKKIDSDALGVLNKSLGLSGAGSPVTELMDGVVDQVLSVNEVARRGRTQAATQGIYTAVFENVHSAGDSERSSVNIYDIGLGVIPPWPDPMPIQFDIWLLGATAIRLSGSGTVLANLGIIYGAAQQGWGRTDTGVGIVANFEHVVANWDSVLQIETLVFLRLEDAGGISSQPGIRLPRSPDTILTFASVSSAAATYRCQVVLGVFPASLGQDGLI